jgi:hypothetical protein
VNVCGPGRVVIGLSGPHPESNSPTRSSAPGQIALRGYRTPRRRGGRQPRDETAYPQERRSVVGRRPKPLTTQGATRTPPAAGIAGNPGAGDL